MRSLRERIALYLRLATGDIQTLAGPAATSVIPSSQISGTTTNDNAAAGRVGEFVTATVATPGVALTTATPANVASISLTAGDWDISAQTDFLLTTATPTQLQCGPSLTTGTLPTQAGGAGLGTDALCSDVSQFATPSGTQTCPNGPIRLSVSATTTVFLVAQATFAIGTVSAYGSIRARRVR